jgi:NAD(P)-dependent dehydrogenase (short-subunit alcohol dehydrogenase family)
MRDLSNQIVFITGGASGIGRGLAERFGAAGARCFIADVNEDLVREAALSMRCTGVPLDVRDAGQVRAVIDGITREHGPIDFLVNSAGIVRAGETHLFEYDDWKRVLDVNLYGVVNCIHAVYPEMVRRRTGHIVNIASIAGLFPSAGQVSYVASKSAVVGLSHALRVEAAPHGVRVSVACPGIIDTPMTRGFSVKAKNPDKVKSRIPRGIDVGECCDVILRGVDRNDATILVGGLAHTLASLHRASPWLSGKLNGLSLRFLNR